MLENCRLFPHFCSVEKVFSVAWFDGQDVLRRRHVIRKPDSKEKVEFLY